MGASVRPDPMDAALAEIRAQGTSSVDPMDAALEEIRKTAPRTLSRTAPAADASSFRRPGASKGGDFGAVASDPKGTARAAFEFGAVGPLVAAQAIPGMEWYQAKAGEYGSKFTDSPLTYEQSLAALQSQTEGIPAPLKMAAQFPAAVRMLPKALTLPKAIGANAAVAGGHGLAQADPNVGVEERLVDAGTNAGKAAGLTALLGGSAALINKGTKYGRLANEVRKTDALDDQAVALDKSIKAETQQNYGKVSNEAKQAATQPTPKDLTDAMDDPDVKVFVDKVRASRRFKNAGDAEVAHEADKLMTRQKSGLRKRMKETGYDADLDLKAGDIEDAQRVLRKALPQSLPSHPKALSEKAAAEGGREALKEGAEMGRKINAGRSTPAKKLESKSQAAYRDRIENTDPNVGEVLSPAKLEKQKAGLLGAAKEGMALPSITPQSTLTGLTFGAVAKPLRTLRRSGPFIEAIDQRLGVPSPRQIDIEWLLRQLGLGTTLKTAP